MDEMTTTNLAELPAFLTAKQVAALLQVSAKHVRDCCREGRIPAIRIGETWRISRDGLLKLIAAN